VLVRAAQHGATFLISSTNPAHIKESFDVSLLPQEAVQEMHDHITTHIRLDTVAEAGVPRFVPRPK
jgi:diketogulonate reductase-like aldo/keto reductase